MLTLSLAILLITAEPSTVGLMTQESMRAELCAPCEAQRRANLDAALVWESRAHETRAAHRACLARLEVRTATPTPAVVEFRSIESAIPTTTLVLGGVGAVLLGVVAGLSVAWATR